MLISNVTRALLGILILSSLWSLMHAFMGGAARDFQALDALQFSGILFSLSTLFACAYLLSRGRGFIAGMKAAWAHTPAWLIFGSVIMLSLAVIGELSYYLLRDAIWIPAAWINRSALICLSLASIAFLLVSGTGQFLSGGRAFPKERW